MPDFLTTDLFLVPLVGVLYVVFFSALSYMRQEGISPRFIIESLVVTAVLTAGAAFTGASLYYPVAALVVLYVVTMRCRLVLDLANNLAQRGRLLTAERLYALARSLFPDDLTRALEGINRGTAWLLYGEPAQAQALIEEALASVADLPSKYEASARYNLGVAYRRQGQEDLARQEFQQVTRLVPENTTYHVRAQRALEWKSSDKA